jgi:hypothetical protein
VADGTPGLPEVWRTVRRIEDSYVSREVFDTKHAAVLYRIERLEGDDTAKKTSNRNALLAMAGTVMGVIVSAVVTLAILRGGH